MPSAARRMIRFTLNDQPVTAEVEPHWTLVDLLQRCFDLFGARESCAQGLCGCCTVVLNGKTVSGCLYLAAFADGATIQTIEQSVSMRVLHARFCADDAATARRQSGSERG